MNNFNYLFSQVVSHKILCILMAFALINQNVVLAAGSAKVSHNRVKPAVEKGLKHKSNKGLLSGPGYLPVEKYAYKKEGVSETFNGVALASLRDLSSNYQVKLFSSNLYPKRIFSSSNVFNLTATYSSNNHSNNWGIGTGWSLNIPYLSFGEWIHTCRGQFELKNEKQLCKPDPSSKVIKDTVSGIPKKIFFHLGGSTEEFTDPSGKGLYVPTFKTNSNYIMEIKTENPKKGSTVYHFELHYKNHPNKKIVFSFDGARNQALVAIESKISNVSSVFHVNVQDSRNLLKGIYIKGEGDRKVSLNNIYPDYQALAVTKVDNIVGDPAGCIANAYDYDSEEYSWNRGDKYRRGVAYSPKPFRRFFSSVGSVHVQSRTCSLDCKDDDYHYDSDRPYCPEKDKATQLKTYGFYTDHSVTYSVSFAADEKKTIEGVNLNGSKETLTLNLKKFYLDIANRLSYNGLVAKNIYYTNKYINQLIKPTTILVYAYTASNYYFNYVVIGITNSRYTNAFVKLASITSTIAEQNIQTVNFDYREELSNGVNYMNNVETSYFGFSNFPVPLLTTITTDSKLFPVPAVTIKYGLAYYNVFYKMRSMFSQTGKTPLTVALVDHDYIEDIPKSKETRKVFDYVSSITVGDKTTNYGWKTAKRNFYHLTDDPVFIDSLSDEFSSLRGRMGIFSAGGLSKSFESTKKEDIESDKKKYSFGVVTSDGTIDENGNTLNDGTMRNTMVYNRYGLLMRKSICNIKETDCQVTEFEYNNRNVEANKDLKISEKIPYNQIKKVTIFHTKKSASNNQKQQSEARVLYSIVSEFGPQNRPIMMRYKDGSDALLHIVKIGYAPDEDPTYFHIADITNYKRPFVSNISSTSNVYEKKHYAYKMISPVGQEDGSETEKINILEASTINHSGLHYAKMSYRYDDKLRPIKIRSCTAKSGEKSAPECLVDAVKQDRYSRLTTYDYDDEKQTVKITHSIPGRDRITTYVPGTPLVASIASANGSNKAFTYDDYGRITDIINKQYWYDGKNHQVGTLHYDYQYSKPKSTLKIIKTDQFSNQSLQALNKLGQVSLQQGPNLNFDGNVPTSSQTKGSLGKYQTKYFYNKHGLVKQRKDFFHDEQDNDQVLRTTTMTYDYLGRPLSITSASEPWGSVTKHWAKTEYNYSYDFNKLIDAKSITKTTRFVGKGKTVGSVVWKLIGSSSHEKHFLTNQVANYFSVPDVNANLSIQMSLRKVDYSTDSKNPYTYQVTSTVRGHPQIQSQYDALGRLVEKTVGVGAFQESMAYVYDDLNRVKAVKFNGKEKPYHLYYDDQGRLSQSTYTYKDNDGKSHQRLTQSKYNLVCLLQDQCDDHKDTFKVMQRTSVTTYPDSADGGASTNQIVGKGNPIRKVEYSYSANGSVSIVTTDLITNKKIKIDSFYNVNLTPQKTIMEDENEKQSSVISFYHKKGMLDKKILDQGNQSTLTQTYSYNDNNRQAGIVMTHTNELSDKPNKIPTKTATRMVINPMTNLLSEKHITVNNTERYQVNYSYDDQNRVSEEKFENAKDANLYYEDRKYTYDTAEGDGNAYGALDSITIDYTSSPKVTAYDSIKESYTYNDDDRLASRLTTMTHTAKVASQLTEKYTYDTLNRLSSYTCDSSAYDRKGVIYNICSGDELSDNLPIKNRTYAFTKDNNIDSITTTLSDDKKRVADFKYDSNGHLQEVSLGDSTLYRLGYDQANNRVSQMDYSSQGSSLKNSYIYNPYGSISQFISEANNKRIDIAQGIAGISQISQTEGSETKQRVYYGGSLYRDLSSMDLHYLAGGNYAPDTDFNISQISRGEAVHYIKGLNDRVLARVIDVNATLWLHTYTAYGNASIYHLIRRANIQSKVTSKGLFYGENGALTLTSSSSKEAQQYQLLGSRTYMPGVMRFMQHDSASPFGGGGLNGFMYGVGNPVGFADPSGHWGNMFQSGFNDIYGEKLSPTFLAEQEEQKIYMYVNLGVQGAMALVGFGAGVFGFVEGIMTASMTLADLALLTANTALSGIAAAGVGVDIAATETGNQHLASIGNMLDQVAFYGGLPLMFLGGEGAAASKLTSSTSRLSRKVSKLPKPRALCTGGRCNEASGACFTGETTVLTVKKKRIKCKKKGCKRQYKIYKQEKKIQEIQLGDFVVVN